MADFLVDVRRHSLPPMVELEGRAVCMPCPCSGLENGPKSESSPGSKKAPGLMRCPSGTCPAPRCGDGGDGPAPLETTSEKCPAEGLVHWDGKDSLHKSDSSEKEEDSVKLWPATNTHHLCTTNGNGTDCSLA